MKIRREDANTFFIESTDKKKEYMIYKSNRIGWTCDCMNFVLNLTESCNYECKHIKKIKEFTL